jgi:hypothetical protein
MKQNHVVAVGTKWPLAFVLNFAKKNVIMKSCLYIDYTIRMQDLVFTKRTC